MYTFLSPFVNRVRGWTSQASRKRLRFNKVTRVLRKSFATDVLVLPGLPARLPVMGTKVKLSKPIFCVQ